MTADGFVTWSEGADGALEVHGQRLAVGAAVSVNVEVLQDGQWVLVWDARPAYVRRLGSVLWWSLTVIGPFVAFVLSRPQPYPESLLLSGVVGLIALAVGGAVHGVVESMLLERLAVRAQSGRLLRVRLCLRDGTLVVREFREWRQVLRAERLAQPYVVNRAGEADVVLADGLVAWTEDEGGRIVMNGRPLAPFTLEGVTIEVLQAGTWVRISDARPSWMKRLDVLAGVMVLVAVPLFVFGITDPDLSENSVFGSLLAAVLVFVAGVFFLAGPYYWWMSLLATRVQAGRPMRVVLELPGGAVAVRELAGWRDVKRARALALKNVRSSDL